MAEEDKKPEASFSPPPNFRPPVPKLFGVRSDKFLDVIGASLALFFRLGTGVSSFLGQRNRCGLDSMSNFPSEGYSDGWQKAKFPCMVDPNTGVAMYEPDDIIRYLVGKYCDGTVPLMLLDVFLSTDFDRRLCHDRSYRKGLSILQNLFGKFL